MANEIFATVSRTVEHLLLDVIAGTIGLPDLQRPFVWKDNKVRDFLDSMLKGYPIGFIMLWESPTDYERKTHIGENVKSYSAPKSLVIDGQQRLTALYSAIKGNEIIDVKYKKRAIKISYNPLKREFAVWSKAYDQSPEWISIISDVFKAKDNNSVSKFRKEYISQLNEFRLKNDQEVINDDEETIIENNINALLNLYGYSIPTLEIRSSASEEDVADIFVRVNSGGQKLTEKNFIETLLAVYDNDLHKQINKFCEESRIPAEKTSYNHIIEVDPVHLIRAAVGFAFERARLRYAYMLLRGKNLETGKLDEETREKNLLAFREAIQIVTNLNNWHAFMNIISDAGYLNGSLISSNNAIIFTYMFYLIGKEKYKVAINDLRDLMKRFFFVATIRGLFTDSPESAVERIFADLRDADAKRFIEYFNNVMKNQFTDDYFKFNLINELEVSSNSSPIWRGYIASMNVLDYNMLFSNTLLSHFFVVGTSGTKHSLDVHHIFPNNYLIKNGIDSERARNQIANFAYIDYTTNIEISDNPPEVYVSEFRAKYGEEFYEKTCKENALPLNFEYLDYSTFLIERRKLMADIIKKAYLKLSNMKE